MGANNLIEPIDARPVFTAFSATLPPTFFFSFPLQSNSSLSQVFPPSLVCIIVMQTWRTSEKRCYFFLPVEGRRREEYLCVEIMKKIFSNSFRSVWIRIE